MVPDEDLAETRMRRVISPSKLSVYMVAMMRKVTEGSVGGLMVRGEGAIDLEFAYNVALLAVTWLVMWIW